MLAEEAVNLEAAIRTLKNGFLDSRVRILYLEAPNSNRDSEIRLPSCWKA